MGELGCELRVWPLSEDEGRVSSFDPASLRSDGTSLRSGCEFRVSSLAPERSRRASFESLQSYGTISTYQQFMRFFLVATIVKEQVRLLPEQRSKTQVFPWARIFRR